MKDSEAQEVLRLIRAAVVPKELSGETIEFWKAQLGPLDAELATKAALAGIREWEFFPSWALYYEAYRAQRAERSRQEAMSENEDSFKRGVEAPEWVWVWSWCRWTRSPAEMRSFPQQEGHVDPTDMLSMDEYKVLRKEWKAAGSPKNLSMIGV